MHIKDSPMKGFKNDLAGFKLDTDKIELHSSDKYKILLSYLGPLPDAFSGNNGAFISVNFAVGLTIGVGLIVTMDGKKLRYSVEATAQEINDVLFPFFFEDVGNNKYHTRFGNGLNDYWLGNYQSSYTHWRCFVYEEHGMDGLINQLSRKALKWTIQYIGDCGKSA